MPEGRFVKHIEVVETTLLVKLNAREYDFYSVGPHALTFNCLRILRCSRGIMLMTYCIWS